MSAAIRGLTRLPTFAIVAAGCRAQTPAGPSAGSTAQSLRSPAPGPARNWSGSRTNERDGQWVEDTAVGGRFVLGVGIEPGALAH